MNETFDLIVVGAGPAGSSCARRAAELGLAVLVLDKAAFPRAKPCGAGLTDKSVSLLGGEHQPAEHRRLHTAEIAFGHHLSLVVDSPDTLVATTTRRELDALLIRTAEDAGATVEPGRAVSALEADGSTVWVTSGTDRMASRHVVVADGARGTGRRMLGLSPVSMGGGLYVRAHPPDERLPERLSERVLFDPTAVPRGYGWVFPKNDHLNVGLFSQLELRAGLKRDLDSFLAMRGLNGWRAEGPFAFPIPVRMPADALGTDRILFAGDAAGLANPVTGEGISSAILSGRLAAESIAGSVDSGVAASEEYARRVEADVVPLIYGSRRKGSFFYGLGPGFLAFAARSPILRGLIAPTWRAATRDNKAFSLTIVEEDPQCAE